MPYATDSYSSHQRFLGFLAVPEGLREFGWCSSPAQSMKDRDTGFSVMHLHDPNVPLAERRSGGRVLAQEPWKGLCGREFTGRWRQHVAGKDARQYCTKHCERCLRAAAELQHVPTYRTRRTGVGNLYGRGASGGGYRLTRVECSCGWENRSNVTKGEQQKNYREHVLGVVDLGLWRVEREGYSEHVVTSHPRFFVELSQWADAVDGLIVGERAGGPVGEYGRVRYVEVERIALPLRRMEER